MWKTIFFEGSFFALFLSYDGDMHTTLPLLIIVLLSIPFSADAAGLDRSTIKRQTRGKYQIDSSQTPALQGYVPKKQDTTPTSATIKSLGISLKYPKNWDLKEQKDRLSLWPIYDGVSLKTKRDSRIVLRTENIVYKRNYSLKELDTYLESHATLSTDTNLGDWYIPSFHLLESGDAKIFGHPARRYVYTGENSSVPEKTIHVLSSFDQKLYSLWYSSPLGTFETDLPVFEDVLKTLTLKKPKEEKVKTPMRNTRMPIRKAKRK